MKRFLYPLILCLFWLITFNVFRIAFLFSNGVEASLFSWLSHSTLLDLAASAYLLLPILLIWAVQLTVPISNKVLSSALFGFNFIFFIVICIIELTGISLYPEWGTVFNARALDYILNDKDAWGTVFSCIGLIEVVGLLLSLPLGFLVLRWIHRKFLFPAGNIINSICVAIVFLALSIIGIRGGLANVPIQVSSAYYSKDQSVNYLSVNKLFYLGNSLKRRQTLLVEGEKYTKETLFSLYDKYFTKTGFNEGQTILNSDRPNVVLIVLEGSPADLFEPLGGQKGITPCFTQLTREGLLFSEFYGSGTRTDQGLLSILGGVPALPYLNVMNDVELVRKFPSLIQKLWENLYSTSFMYGGNLDFSNFNNYFLHNKTGKIIGKNNFNLGDQKIEWGVPDDILFKRASSELKKEVAPFFSCILTQSSHKPFDIQTAYKFGNSNEEEMYKSTVFFTDSVIGEFISECKKESWYKNTLFIITADHGSMYLANTPFNSNRRFQVPLLMFGPALKHEYYGKINAQFGNTSDVPSTLLAMLKLENREFPFSRNMLLSRQDPFGYWATEHTLGWITKGQRIVINHETRELYDHDGPDKEALAKVDTAMMYYKMISNYVLRK